jgi:hypothetical protein
MVQNTFSDCWPKPLDMHEALLDKSSTRNWIQGNAIISITSLKEQGGCHVVFRRPTGVLVFSSKLENPSQARNRILEPFSYNRGPSSISNYPKSGRNASEGFLCYYSLGHLLTASPKIMDGHYRSRSVSGESMDLLFPTNPPNSDPVIRSRSLSLADGQLGWIRIESPLPSSEPLIDPSFFLLQFAPYPSFSFSTLEESPRLLPLEDSINRSISVLDHTPITDLHKIGLVYVSKNQTTEAEILANTRGSPLYTIFICSLGELFSLLNARYIYTGGLDTSEELYDGANALMFTQDQRMGQIIFHVTTLMPTRKDDVQQTAKKRHIGNDYVSIIWNEAGMPYKQDTIPGQFNYVVIIIEPLADPNARNYTDSMFRVTVSCQTDLPEQLKMDSSKLVLGSSLGAYIRQLAVHANMYCQVASSKDLGYISNARERLRQIKRIKNRNVSANEGLVLDFTKNL